MRNFALMLFLVAVLCFTMVSCETKVANNCSIDIYHVSQADLLLYVQTDTINQKLTVDICDYIDKKNHPDSSVILGTIEWPLNIKCTILLPDSLSNPAYVMAYGDSIYTSARQACIVNLSKKDFMELRKQYTVIELPSDYLQSSKQLQCIQSSEYPDIIRTKRRKSNDVTIYDMQFPKDLEKLFSVEIPERITDSLSVDESQQTIFYKGSAFKPQKYYVRDGLFSGDTYTEIYLNPYYPNCIFYDTDQWPMRTCFHSDNISVIVISPFMINALCIYRDHSLSPQWIAIRFDSSGKCIDLPSYN